MLTDKQTNGQTHNLLGGGKNGELSALLSLCEFNKGQGEVGQKQIWKKDRTA